MYKIVGPTLETAIGIPKQTTSGVLRTTIEVAAVM